MTDEEILSMASKSGLYLSKREYLFRDIILEFTRAIAQKQREKDAAICTNQRYMVLQPMRTYSAEDLCTAQKDSAKTLAKMILAQERNDGHR